ncbi:phenazine antibiotic biosynthesis protein [Nocardia transvalensis]|uniref:phenazine antibiotic biosynthesis protein n=1 Tax=Nocardia transvalensis TaxID=37333 RepID=UPI001895F813|nr:phenazine antibiotic biosynthesis protein [Nocardia transvalensis]MBF6329855.1 phenazine antibiotic biosynthesis protein [Nocardia transvalensis]
MAVTDFSLLDLPITQGVDPNEYLRVVMQWHFGPETGSRFWLERAAELDFDPRVDVESFDDLALFPNVVDEMRDVPVEDLIPQGYGPDCAKPRIFESGGTTGAPKRVIFTDEWMDHVVERSLRWYAEQGSPIEKNLLSLFPSGPHFVGAIWDHVARKTNTIKYAVDIDPRWVKLLTARGDKEGVQAYTDHILDQALYVLRTQDVGVLCITPPMLRQLTRRREAVDLVNAKITLINWGGAHMTTDDRFEYTHIHFPEVELWCGSYGSTMILGHALQRPGLGPDDDMIFDPDAPIVTFRVIDPATGEPVQYGRRGQVVMNHLSKGMFLPNNLERDTALRVPAPGNVGDSVAAVQPVDAFGGERVIEGIY